MRSDGNSETIMSIAKTLAKFHKPIKIDYKKRFGIEEISPSKQKPATGPVATGKIYYCSQCKKAITEKVAKFCWDNKRKFGGKAYCFNCQKNIVGGSGIAMLYFHFAINTSNAKIQSLKPPCKITMRVIFVSYSAESVVIRPLNCCRFP
jgi:hypothetical protein